MTTADRGRPIVAVVPDSWPAMHDALVDAVAAGGAEPVGADRLGEAEAIVWADPRATDTFPSVIEQAGQVRWVQLPYAGIEGFVSNLDHDRVWTCAKGVYADPVAEHVLGSLLLGLRNFHAYARAHRWSGPAGRNLLDAHVVVLGGGGITESLLRLLAPFRCEVTIVRRGVEPTPGANRTVTVNALDDHLRSADALVVAWALTEETEGFVDARVFDLLPDHAWLVNVGRGPHVVVDDLVAALDDGRIGGAVLDVTNPEPLPEGHPLWSRPNCVVTPHVGNTPDMGRPLLAARVRANVARFVEDPEALDRLEGLVDVEAGY